jgi:uncharacterized repeat protein (TIGR01451 family)
VIRKPGFARSPRLRTLSTRIAAAFTASVALALVAGAATGGALPASLLSTGLFAKASAPAAVSWREASGKVAVTVRESAVPWFSFRDGLEVPVDYASDAMKSGDERPLAVASGDLDRDGTRDLVAAYARGAGGTIAVHRGNVDAIYPNAPEAAARRADGTFTDAPFLPSVRSFDTPEAPDFAGAGDFDADGKPDVVVGSRGGTALWVLPGDGSGGFGEARRVALPGPLTALAVDEVNRRNGREDVVAAIGGAVPRLLVFDATPSAFSAEPEAIDLEAAATDLVVGQFAGDTSRDIAAVVGGKVALVQGRDRTPRRSRENPAGVAAPASVETRALGAGVVAIAAGDFSGDGRDTLAALTVDGTIRELAAPAGADKRGLKGWKSERMASGLDASGARLVRARVSSRAGDDLVVVSPASDRLRLVEGGDAARKEAAAPIDLDVAGGPVAVAGMRLNRDGIDDLVVMRKTSPAPVVVETTPRGSFVVTNANDGGSGSLSNAITMANDSPGADVITFNITPSASTYTINQMAPLPGIGEAVTIDATTQPEFAGTPIVELDGLGLDTSGFVVQMPASNVVIRGFSIVNWGGDGVVLFSETSSTTIEGNYIGLLPDGVSPDANGGSGVNVGSSLNTIGGTTAAARNVISGNGAQGVRIDGSSPDSNVIRGNYIGTTADGNGSLSNTFNGIEIVAVSTTTIGGTAAGSRNVISGNTASGFLSNGVYIQSAASDVLVQGNIIGLAANGSSYLGNGANGVLDQSFFSTVGGFTPAARNVISGNGADGVASDGASSCDIVGNVIGLEETVQFDRRNDLAGVSVFNGSSIRVGNSDGGGNVISRNLEGGVLVVGSFGVEVDGNAIGTGFSGTEVVGNLGYGVAIDGSEFMTVAFNRIFFNAGNGIEAVEFGGGQGRKRSVTPKREPIFSTIAAFFGNEMMENNGLGIDLEADGVTANDAGDLDDGANGLVNFPVITMADTDGSNGTVSGTYNGPPDTAIRIEFFLSSDCDPSGNGEGTFPAGTWDVLTDGSGNATFTDVALSIPATFGQVVTATATTLAIPGRGGVVPEATSEFSACVAFTGAGADLAATNIASVSTAARGEMFDYTVTVTNNGPQTATIPFFSSSLPANVGFVSMVTEPGWTPTTPPVGSSGTVSAFTPSLASGATATFVITVEVLPSASGGEELQSFVNAAANESDPNPSDNSAILASVFVENGVDIAVTQTDSPDPVLPGQDITYTISVVNNGPDFPFSLNMNGTIPAGTTFQSFSAPPGWNVSTPPVGSGGAYSAELITSRDKARGLGGDFTLVVRVNPETPGGATISHTVMASSPEPDPVPGNNSSTEMTQVGQTADLQVTKSAGAETVLPGQPITYTITVTNNGPGDATAVQLTEIVPSNTTFQSFSAPAGWSVEAPPVGGTGSVTASTAMLPSGGMAAFTYTVLVDGGASGAVIQNNATVSSSTPDPDSSNNSDTFFVFVDFLVDMAVAQTDAPDPVQPGQNITYTITVTNNGPDFPFVINLSGATPANTTFVSLETPEFWVAETPPVGGTGSFTATLFQKGGARERRGADVFTFVVKVDEATPDATVITNTVNVSSPDPDPVPGNNMSAETTTVMVPVTVQADLALTKTATPDPAFPGQTLTYTVTVRNNGPNAADGVTLSEMVPVGTTFQSVSAPPGWTCTLPEVGGMGSIVCTTPSLAADSIAIFTVAVRVDEFTPSGTVIENSASVLSDSTPDPNQANNFASASTPVSGPASANLAVSMTATPDEVTAGGTITYTITALNNGPNPAIDLSISNPIPTGTSFVTATASTGGTVTAPSGAAGSVIVSWPGTTAVGETRTATVVLRVNTTAAVGTIITNRATATSGSLDGDLSNNTAQATATVVTDESVPSSNLSILLGEVPTVVDTGTFLSYTIVVTNNGPDDAENVRIAGSTPENTRFVSVESDGTFTGPPVGGTGAFEVLFASIPAGESRTITITVNVIAEGGMSLGFDVVVSSDTNDPSADNNAAAATTTVQAGNDVILQWDPPIECPDDCLNPPLHLQTFPVDGTPAKTFTGQLPALMKRNTVTGYRIYRSNNPNVTASPENFFSSVPPNQTSVVVPTAPGGSFFTVTATYPNGESDDTNAASGGLPEPIITGVRLKGAKTLVLGEGFTDSVEVFVNGIPFRKNAKVKNEKGRVVQKGKLLTGQDVDDFIRQQGGVVLISVLNSDRDNAIGTFLYRP